MFDSPSELRIGIFDDDRSKDFLNDTPCAVVATSGAVRLESYDRYIAFDISSYDGQKIMLNGAYIATSAHDYNLISHNCDDVALKLLGCEGINLSHGTVCIPNITYNNNQKN